MPAGVGYGGEPPPPEAILGGMDAMLGGAPPGAPPGVGATELPGSEGGDSDVIAALVMENVQLRALVGLGPDDPVPMPEGAGPAAGPPGVGGPPPPGALPPGVA